MAEQTRVAKVIGRFDTYVFVTVDLAESQIMRRMSDEFSEANIREELKRRGLSPAQIDATITNAQDNQI